jgi:small subunit ribosomal protein S16
MLKIRLRRVGAKGRPSYRIVVADSRSPRDGRFLEVVGFYDPLTQPATITVKADRLQYWQGVGAQCSDVVNQVLQSYQKSQSPAAEAAGQA